MFCKKCGYKLEENTKFCINCGANLDGEDNVQEIKEEVLEQNECVKPNQNNSSKAFDVFAKLGFGLGLGGLLAAPVTCGLFIMVNIAGIIFSTLGKKSALYSGKARTGLVLSIIGTVVAFIMLIIYYAYVILLSGAASLETLFYY